MNLDKPQAARRHARVGAIALALALACAGGAARADVQPYTATAAPDWTAMFTRQTGWTGADGVFSFPRSGDDRVGSGANGQTFFIFSDTFVGNVNADGSRAGGTVMVNNTSALLDGNVADASRLQFNVRTSATGVAKSMVLPTQPDTWFWPGDGVVQNGTVFMSALRMKTGTGGAFNFAVDGTAWLTASAADPVPFLGKYRITEAPALYAPPLGKKGETTFGSAVMALTATAGAPQPDGYVYVYGVRNDSVNKKLMVARVKAGALTNSAAYRYWDGTHWQSQINKAAVLTDRMASEFSVTPLADGRFLLVFQLDALGRTIAVRYGASPVGPWSAPIAIWDCPEVALTPNIVVYGAKAHPHLSNPGELLISYHVNSLSFVENLQDADIYHPRFIRLPLN